MEFHYPKDIRAASSLLRRKSSLAVAGGTSFIAPPRAENLVDLTSLKLNYIKEGKKDIVIGATVTSAEISESKALKGSALGILKSAASTSADKQLQNVITIGGNIACRYNWACLPPALMVLDASLKIAGRKDRVLPIGEFFQTKLSPGELIKEVIIPKKSASGKGTFVKFARTSFDYSVVTIAARAEKNGNMVTNLKVAISGVTRPMRIKSIEDELQGKVASHKSIEEAAAKVAAQLPILKSYLFDEEYLRKLTGVLLKRALTQVLMEG